MFTYLFSSKSVYFDSFIKLCTYLLRLAASTPSYVLRSIYFVSSDPSATLYVLFTITKSTGKRNYTSSSAALFKIS